MSLSSTRSGFTDFATNTHDSVYARFYALFKWLHDKELFIGIEDSNVDHDIESFAPVYVEDELYSAIMRRLRSKLSFRDVAEMFLERGWSFRHEAVRDWEARCCPAAPNRFASSDSASSEER